MPSAEDILNQLAQAANEWRWLAVLWHLAIVSASAGFIVGWRPSVRAAGLMLALPLISVAFVSMAVGNLFNTIVPALIAVLASALAVRLPTKPIGTGPFWSSVGGVILLGFGIFYPHFLDAESPLEYVYAAPVGVVPCPTLSVIIGCLLITGGFRSVPYSAVFVVAGLYYGIFGALRLGVAIDWILVVGSCTLAILAARIDWHPSSLQSTQSSVRPD